MRRMRARSITPIGYRTSNMMMVGAMLVISRRYDPFSEWEALLRALSLSRKGSNQRALSQSFSWCLELLIAETRSHNDTLIPYLA